MPTQYGRTVTENRPPDSLKRHRRWADWHAASIPLPTQPPSNAAAEHLLPRLRRGCHLSSENRRLHEQIQQTAPFYPNISSAQNRCSQFSAPEPIISGMCLGILVVEAGAKVARSSPQISRWNKIAKCSRPGSIISQRSIAEPAHSAGAKPCADLDDIFEEIALKLVVQKCRKAAATRSERCGINRCSSGCPTSRHIDQLVLELDQSPAVLLGNCLINWTMWNSSWCRLSGCDFEDSCLAEWPFYSKMSFRACPGIKLLEQLRISLLLIYEPNFPQWSHWKCWRSRTNSPGDHRRWFSGMPPVVLAPMAGVGWPTRLPQASRERPAQGWVGYVAVSGNPRMGMSATFGTKRPGFQLYGTDPVFQLAKP